MLHGALRPRSLLGLGWIEFGGSWMTLLSLPLVPLLAGEPGHCVPRSELAGSFHMLQICLPFRPMLGKLLIQWIYLSFSYTVFKWTAVLFRSHALAFQGVTSLQPCVLTAHRSHVLPCPSVISSGTDTISNLLWVNYIRKCSKETNNIFLNGQML